MYWMKLLYINQFKLVLINYSWKQILVKSKPKNQYPNIKLVCVVHLSISTILSFTNGSKHKTKLTRIPKSSWRSSSSSRLDPKPWSTECKWVILKLGHGNHQVKASKLLFLKQSPTNILLNDLKLKSQDY